MDIKTLAEHMFGIYADEDDYLDEAGYTVVHLINGSTEEETNVTDDIELATRYWLNCDDVKLRKSHNDCLILYYGNEPLLVRDGKGHVDVGDVYPSDDGYDAIMDAAYDAGYRGEMSVADTLSTVLDKVDSFLKNEPVFVEEEPDAMEDDTADKVSVHGQKIA